MKEGGRKEGKEKERRRDREGGGMNEKIRDLKRRI